MYVARIGAHKIKRGIHASLGELVATISDIAFEYAGDGEEAYEIARRVLVDVLRDASLTIDRHFPASKYLH
jgi:urease gamma subunit